MTLGKPDCPCCGGTGSVELYHGPPHNPYPSGFAERCECRDELLDEEYAMLEHQLWDAYEAEEEEEAA